MLLEQLADAVGLDDVLRDRPVALGLRLIGHHEDEIEPGEERGGHVDLLADRDELVEPPEFWVRRSKEGAPGLQGRGDAGFCDRDRVAAPDWDAVAPDVERVVRDFKAVDHTRIGPRLDMPLSVCVYVRLVLAVADDGHLVDVVGRGRCPALRVGCRCPSFPHEMDVPGPPLLQQELGDVVGEPL